MKKFAMLVLAICFGLASAAVVRADDKKTGPTLETIKKLAGDWVEVGKDGKPTDTVVSNIRVTAGGSTVVETLFPGTPHEMLTVYNMDGKDLVLTHYCILGNQPRLRAAQSDDPKTLNFKFEGGANIDPAKSNHMHEATITLVDADHIKSVWTRCDEGKPCETKDFSLVRKAKLAAPKAGVIQ
ncbi:MAG TPA: hypothetical protein VGP68_13145 [Gemmataceae bacterium]|jgi:hypothetical protein|nr:hypothetical protein [Gemmataceae bacterium]